MYYENINGKEKKVEKTFTDPKAFDAFTNKLPFPLFWDFFWLPTKTKALPKKPKAKAKKPVKKPIKKVVKKKK